jgi:F-type H+-transporting ATPase subunit a
MNEELTRFALLLNKAFGGVALAVMSALHITPSDPDAPIPNHVAMGIVVLLIAVVFFLWLRTRISVERPGVTQQVMEFVLTNPMRVGISDLLRDSSGHHYKRYIPIVGSVTIFILMSNLLSVIPGFSSPTGHVSVPLACAIVTFLFYNLSGVRELGGLGYAKTFAGPVPMVSPLIFPVELISNLARLMSLTVRLWANMFASELIYTIFLGMLLAPAVAAKTNSPALGIILGVFPATIPVLFILLHVFVAVVQAFIFTILPAVYLGMATSGEH